MTRELGWWCEITGDRAVIIELVDEDEARLQATMLLGAAPTEVRRADRCDHLIMATLLVNQGKAGLSQNRP